jgi:hypothetical protein
MDPRYEAWRNLLLILAGLLVADALTSFRDIRAAIISLLDFDKTIPNGVWPELVAGLVVVYVAKNAHGVLITLFDDAYFENIYRDRIAVALSCLFTGLVVASFAMVVRSAAVVTRGDSVGERGLLLMTLTLLPSIALLMFDLFHLFIFEYRSPQRLATRNSKTAFERRTEFVREYVMALAREIVTNPLRRSDHAAYKRIWVLEDLLTIFVLCGWAGALVFAHTMRVSIWWTVVAFVGVLAVNSIGDYVLNFNYFFQWRRVEKTKGAATVV